MKYQLHTLTQHQYDTLNRIARRTKMDCWFSIRQKNNGIDYFYDLEERKRLCLRTGVRQLLEGIDHEDIYDQCALSCMESLVFCDLCRYLDIEIPAYMNPIIRKGISSENLIALLREDHIDYELMHDDENAIKCQDYVFQFDEGGMLFDIVPLFYVARR